MQLKVHPKSLNENGITGWVLVTIKPQDERLDMYKALSIKVEGDSVSSSSDPIDQAKAMNKLARENIIEAEIEFEGVKYDKEALFMYEDFSPAILEIASLCLKGPTLSKKL